MKRKTSRKTTKTTKTSQPEKAKRGRPRKQAAPNTSRTVVRQITDTVGIVLGLRDGDPLPKENGTVHVKTDKGEEFDLRISKVQPKKHGGYCVWCWLRKGAGDGKRWQSCRLQQATITY